MDPLNDWYRYLDRHSRPVKRSGDEPPASEASSWRPWDPEGDQEDLLAPAPALEIPVLSLGGALGHSLDTSQPATRAFEDPTLHDELDPIPEYTIPRLQAPAFDVDKPSLRDAAEANRVRPIAPPPEPEGGRTPRTAREHLELLEQVRGADAEAPRRGRTGRESRDQLLHRLLDPELTLEETARLLEVCPTTVRRYTNRGLLPHMRTPGNQRRFRLSDVLEFLESRSGELAADRAAERAGANAESVE
jgi:excisionase family DNA binding protein